jgi:hypothetical protein
VKLLNPIKNNFMIEDFKVYRWYKGGVWYLYKYGTGTPYNMSYCEWRQTKATNTTDIPTELITIEDYEKDTRLFSKIFRKSSS